MGGHTCIQETGGGQAAASGHHATEQLNSRWPIITAIIP